MGGLAPLGENESIFSNLDSLEIGFVPKLLPHRENEQREIASAVSPLLRGASGRNVLVEGRSGIGKSHAVRRVLADFRGENESIGVAYINCWSYKSAEAVWGKALSELGFKSLSSLPAPELLERAKQSAQRFKGIVFAFDEVDKAVDYSFLYAALEEFEKKSIIVVSNDSEWFAGLDDRIRGRLMPQRIGFKEYSLEEVRDILRERMRLAFFQDTWARDALELVSVKTFQAKDIRLGLRLLKEAGLSAEAEAQRTVLEKHVRKALEKLR